MKRIFLVLLVVLMAGVCWGDVPLPYQGISPTTLLRITDGIGSQYACISGGWNAWGFGGDGDTLTTDTTVSLGTLRNIKRIKEGTDASLSELLPIFISSRTHLDSSYMYTKWSSVCWGLNNFYSPVGGLSAKITAMGDSGRLGPYFARVARANGVYLSPKVVYPASMNFGSGAFSSDSTFTYSDSFNIDSSLYGPGLCKATSGSQVTTNWPSLDPTNACSLIVYGSNQSLIHGRKWWVLVLGSGIGTYNGLTPYIVGDSLYGIDSVKRKAFVGPAISGNVLFRLIDERVDSL
jgi:hypothetical protein